MILSIISIIALVLSVGSVILTFFTVRSAQREQALLLGAIKRMNDEVLSIYHCKDARCSKCWGNAKSAHDLALNTFERRGLLHLL